MNIQRKIEEKVFSFLEQHDMICPHDHIILGVSGGADSVCLLFVLLEYAKRVPLKLSVVHVNHGLRPDAAEDAGYVEELCRQYGIPFILTEADVRSYAADEKCSEEDAGRRIRYEAFRKAAEETGANKIAVAHNCNDRAETMLFHLFRGSGLKGLCGIRPVRQEIIRPVLCLERKEIEEYLMQRQILWRRDSTNEEDNYARNRIRHHILPYAEKELAQGCVGRMAQTADILTETEDYMGQQTLAARERCVTAAEEKFELSVKLFEELHPALQKRLLYMLAQELSPTGKDISAVHIAKVRSLFEGTGNRSVDLPMGIRAFRSYQKVYIEKRRESEKRAVFSLDPKELAKKGVVFFGLGEQEILEFAVFSGEQCEKVPQNQYTKWFDYDKIKKSLNVRCRKTGDFLSIADGQGKIVHKSLKDYMITEKIPREDRDRLPLLTEEQHVLWIVGGRISEYYKIDKNTKHILQVQLKRSCFSSKTEEENERTC